MKNSLKEIIEGIISIVEGMDGLAAVEYTTSYEIAVDNTKDFPRLFLIVNSPSNILEQYNQVSIDFLFLDIMTSDVDHIQKDYEIKSDMAQQASILFDILENQGYFGEDINITLEPITGEYMDGLSGMGCTVPFAIEKPCFEDGVPVLPFTVTIDTPTTGSEFEEGTDITVTQTFSRVNDDITRVDLVIDGVVEDSHFVAPFDADFIISGLELGVHSIYINAWEGDVLADKSNTVNLTVVRVPLTLTINQPTEAEEFVTGVDVDVNYTFDRLAPEVDKVELWIDGVLSQTDVTAPFDTFTISAVTEGNKLIEVKAYEGATELAADSVNIEVVSGFEAETIAYMTAISVANDGTVYQSGNVNEMTGAERWTAVDNLIVQLKTDGLWPKLQRMGRLFSDDATMAAINVVDPLQFTGTYFGGWVHGFGSKGNATNTYMTTGFVPSVQQVDGNSGLTYVAIAENTASDSGGRVHIGSYVADGNNSVLGDVSEGDFIRYNAGFQFTNSGASNPRVAVHTISRIGTNWRKFTNGTFIKTDNGTGSNPSIEFYEGAWNNNGLAGLFSNATYGPTAYHEGLSDAEIGLLYTALDAFCAATHIKTWI